MRIHENHPEIRRLDWPYLHRPITTHSSWKCFVSWKSTLIISSPMIAMSSKLVKKSFTHLVPSDEVVKTSLTKNKACRLQHPASPDTRICRGCMVPPQNKKMLETVKRLHEHTAWKAEMRSQTCDYPRLANTRRSSTVWSKVAHQITIRGCIAHYRPVIPL